MRTIILYLLLGFTVVCLSSCETKIGDCKVYIEDNEVFVDGFNYTKGLSGINSTNFNVDFDELDEYVYKFCKKTTSSTVYVTLIAEDGEDQYGNKEYKRITIGSIDTKETEKYVDYSKWKRANGTEKMFYKDKREYDRKVQEKMGNWKPGSFWIIERYMPKSIK